MRTPDAPSPAAGPDPPLPLVVSPQPSSTIPASGYGRVPTPALRIALRTRSRRGPTTAAT